MRAQGPSSTRLAACLAAALGVACGEAPARTSAREPPAQTAHPAPERPDPVDVAPEAAPPIIPAIRITPQHEAAIDRAVHEALASGAAPGCVVVLGRADGIVFRRAYGARAIDPAREPMTVDTIFDLASLTKAVATTSAVMWLAEHDRIDLDAAASTYLPALRGGGRARITLRQLLTHTSGLPPVDPLSAYGDDREAAIARILRTPLEAPPGARARYSDLGFIVLGALVEQVSGQGLDAFVQEHVFRPLGMDDTEFTPSPSPRIAPTERAERRGGIMIRGVVHDPRAFRLGGVAGNAGLFSTAGDLARFARMLLGGGALGETRIFRPETVRAMSTRAMSTGDSARALGWDMGHPTLSPRAFGHGGFTGTSLWIDPAHDLFVLLLSNRVHPDGGGSVQGLVRELGRIAREAVPASSAPSSGRVLSGIDVLRREGFARLAGARVVLLTHDAARARDGARSLDLFASASALTLVRALSPEHGMSGRHEGRVRDGRDARTGVEVHSLFGATRTPTGEMLEGADTLVVDLVDVGTRFYTYAATMRRAMDAAEARGMRVWVLDRPNPLGGGAAAGIVSEPALRSFVNHHPLPTMHGMTMGELARLLDAEREIGGELTVVRMEGWRRGMPFEETGLRWVAPSPNLRTPSQARLYPALGLLEGTNVSVGRGTGAPFQLLGAPWMDPEAMLAEIGTIEGLRIEAARFTPRSARHRRTLCRGLRLTLVDAERFEPVRAGLTLARALRRVHAEEWDADAMLPLLGDREIHRALLEGAEVDALLRMAEPALERFAARRRPHLLYE